MIDATRKFDKRASETEEEHQSRIFKQKVRQREGRSKETSEKTKSRLAADAERRVLKRAAGAGAAVYEKMDMPGQDWVTWMELNTDRTPKWHEALDFERDRKAKSRAAEPDDKKELRKSKDAKYHKEKREAETIAELNDRRTRDVTGKYNIISNFHL